MTRFTDHDIALPAEIISGDVSHAPLLAAIHEGVFDAPWSKQSFTELLTLPTVAVWLAVAKDPVGFVLTQQAVDEVEILTIAVCANTQRKGIGRSLVQAALVDAKGNGASKSHLEVAEDNSAARHLYTSLGFSESGRRRGYYSRADKTVDAITMVKDLT